MAIKRPFLQIVSAWALTLALGGLVPAAPSAAETLVGASQKLGNGAAHLYAELDSDGNPVVIGIAFDASLLEGLPPKPNTVSRCFDLDGNGKINDQGECEGDYELNLSLPEGLAERPDMPFKWVGMNWNPHGHAPAGTYDLPHFDFHFYMASYEAIDAIRVGPCGFFINCDDFKRATMPVPGKYVHPEHVNVDAAVGKMGNHLFDMLSGELRKPPETFTQTFIFGAFDGHITFYEPMITRAYLKGRPDVCLPIKQPRAWEVAGRYPTKYCMRYHAGRGRYTISLEAFVLREAG